MPSFYLYGLVFILVNTATINSSTNLDQDAAVSDKSTSNGYFCGAGSTSKQTSPAMSHTAFPVDAANDANNQSNSLQPTRHGTPRNDNSNGNSPAITYTTPAHALSRLLLVSRNSPDPEVRNAASDYESAKYTDTRVAVLQFNSSKLQELVDYERYNLIMTLKCDTRYVPGVLEACSFFHRMQSSISSIGAIDRFNNIIKYTRELNNIISELKTLGFDVEWKNFNTSPERFIPEGFGG